MIRLMKCKWSAVGSKKVQTGKIRMVKRVYCHLIGAIKGSGNERSEMVGRDLSLSPSIVLFSSLLLTKENVRFVKRVAERRHQICWEREARCCDPAEHWEVDCPCTVSWLLLVLQHRYRNYRLLCLLSRLVWMRRVPSLPSLPLLARYFFPLFLFY